MALRLRLLGVFACFAAAACASDRAGETCSRNADCDDLACTADLDPNADDLDPLALSCSSERPGRGAAESCNRGSNCASGICLLAQTCAEPCRDAGDCSHSQRCQSVYARGDHGQLHGLSACVAMVDLPDDTTRTFTTAHGEFRGGMDRILLPGVAQTTLFVIEHLDDDTWPVPSPDTSCRPPLCAQTFKPKGDDAFWFDSEALDDPAGPIDSIAIGDHVYPLTVLIPNGPRATPTDAGYELNVETKHAGDARISMLFGGSGGDQLDLNLYFVGAAEFKDAPDNELPETITGAIEEVNRIFEPTGVFIGGVRPVRVTGALLDRGSDLPDAEVSRGFVQIKEQYGVYPQLPELFKLSAGAGNAALDVFFVGDIDAQGGGDVGGITGGTPIPWGMHGLGSSGIAIAADPFRGDPQRLGRTLAHELGHALGLFHTTEVDGEVFDPLPDTPACDPMRDKDGAGLDADDCADAGADNLMFPTTSASASKLTEDQAAVMRRALILK